MASELQRFLAEVRKESRAAGKEADLDAYGQHFELARLLLDLRREHGLTQVQLSAASGVQQSEISRIERGEGNPTVATMNRLAGAMGMKVALVPATSGRRQVRRAGAARAVTAKGRVGRRAK